MGSRGGTPLFDIHGYVPLEQGMVFKVLRVYNSTTERLQNRVSFWTGSLSKSVKTCAGYICNTNIFFPKHLFLRF